MTVKKGDVLPNLISLNFLSVLGMQREESIGGDDTINVYFIL